MTQEPPVFDVGDAYAEHGGELLGFAVNACGDRGLAEECVQETFTRAWLAADRYDPARGSLRTWLFAILRRVVIDQQRHRARRPVRLVGVTHDDTADEVRDHGRIEDHLTLLWALARVGPTHRRVIVAVRLEGMTYAELAEHDGVPVATLRTRMYHALRALRSILDAEDRS